MHVAHRGLLLIAVLAVACGKVASEGVPVAIDASTPPSADPPVVSSTPSGSPDGGRPFPVACTNVRPPLNASAPGACRHDTDCDGGRDGRCDLSFGDDGGRTSVCTYDACTTDQDCAGSVCGCAVGSSGENLCLTNSNCRVDADCATGQRCAFSYPYVLTFGNGIRTGDEVDQDSNYHGYAVGYFCTTPNDQCMSPKPDLAADCVFDFNTKLWIWGYQP